jgi:hypothetical protein
MKIEMIKGIKNFFFRLTHWETWHYLWKYAPIMPVWLWYCFRAGSWWFFTPSNPTISFGGFEGERKSEIYKQLPPGSYPHSIYISPVQSFDEVLQKIQTAGIACPFIAKPDAGMMGLMFRHIRSTEELKTYHHKMMSDYIIQEMIDYPVEVSVFYYRFPGQAKGTITGFIKKEFLHVTGNGASTLLELIIASDSARFRQDEMKAKHWDKLSVIVPFGEVFLLSYALNLSRGGKMISLEHEKDSRLLQIFDGLSHYAKHFYYGRYDIKCQSVEDLKQGKNFSILEYNGCGAEPHHAYGNGNSLWKAYGIFLHHWKVLYNIAAYNHRNGFPRLSFKEGWECLKKGKENFRLIKKLDAETQL